MLEIARGYNTSTHYPWCEEDQEIRLPWAQQCFVAHATSRLGQAQEGLLVDCGAIDNLASKNFVDRQSRLAELATGQKTEYEKMELPLEVNGVGKGGQRSTHGARVPICIEGEMGEFQAPVLSGDGANAPGLWGYVRSGVCGRSSTRAATASSCQAPEASTSSSVLAAVSSAARTPSQAT